jgi:hypothetical protein
MRRLLLAGWLLSAGCRVVYPGDGRPVAVDSRVPEYDVWVRQAAEVWKEAGARLVPKAQADPSWPSVPVEWGGKQDGLAGQYAHSGTVRVFESGLASCPGSVLAHELGHAMGLDHVGGDGHLMSCRTSCQLDLDEEDLAEHARVWP